MTIFLLTENPRKIAEYRDQFRLYGISKSLVPHPPMDEESIADLLRSAQGEASFALREEADLYTDCGALPRPYRHYATAGLRVVNRSRAKTYHLSKDGALIKAEFEAAIPGHLKLPEKARSDVFDWDDVFVPDQASWSYHEALSGPGKVSARSLVLDDIISRFLPFRSNRAFKYGQLNDKDLVDLNHWPIGAGDAIDFATLPIDVLTTNPQFSHPDVRDSAALRLLRAALSEGAHFRLAGNRREWLYWAPGINAGIPATPKEDPTAELIYLAHDFAHYALPDLIVDTAPEPASDSAIIFHRMIGETMAMVIADMFIMDGFVHAGFAADAEKHGIHQVYALADLRSRMDEEQAFATMLHAVVHALLLGKPQPLLALLPETCEAQRSVERFMSRYQKFALADFEWTISNLADMRAKEVRFRRWLDLLPPYALHDLQLTRSSDFIGSLGPCLHAAQSPEEVLELVLDRALHHDLLPKMARVSLPERPEILSRSLRRYFVGQLMLYAQFDDCGAQMRGLEPIQAAIGKPDLTLDEADRLRDLYEQDLARLEEMHRITPIDAEVYRSVIPIVRPHYVSYASPRYASHAELFELFMPSRAIGTAVSRKIIT